MPTRPTRAHGARPRKTRAVPQPARRSLRSDGAETRRDILLAAGPIFADKGFDRATSLEICAAAGTNAAAVNYHFGGKDGLYEAVLVEAHGALVQIDELEALSRSQGRAEDRLRGLIAMFVQRSGGLRLPWALRVLVSELTSPSPHVSTLISQAVRPKIQRMMTILAGVLGVDEDDPLVQRAVAFVVLPCLMLAIAPREVLGQLLPHLVSDPERLIDDLTRYALSGLGALRRHAAGHATSVVVAASPRRRRRPAA
jgi:AcrR family transcriptional regulator